MSLSYALNIVTLYTSNAAMGFLKHSLYLYQYRYCDIGIPKRISHFDHSRTPRIMEYIKKRPQRQHEEMKCVGKSGQMLKIVRYFYYLLTIDC